MIIFIKLLLVHFLADFVFQSDQWAKDKAIKKHRSPLLYLHALLHGLLSMAIVAEVLFWPFALAIALTHWIIDWTKLVFQKKETEKQWFFIDQGLHLLTLAIIVWMYSGQYIDFLLINQEKWLLLITGTVFLTLPVSILIRVLLTGWLPTTQDNENNSLQNAGKYIGISERLLIFIFILTNHWEGIGFLLAAKSIFRFGDLKESGERKLTEYVMIGTLLSFGLAILTGMLIQSLL